ncbi:hypothetical protein M408DRAFT_331351 [Serendipita vermifera MAFF 305830]|uniref:Endopolyphosphatase n=1 Tax=Serendipita vermifera MAFF 305830 TaxID=933852 RepID=A0A0C3AZ61_SERVB|nr:hypothetical protein M408DRAFT_331351 [Serendipita vermifera MAFF 305830]
MPSSEGAAVTRDATQVAGIPSHNEDISGQYWEGSHAAVIPKLEDEENIHTLSVLSHLHPQDEEYESRRTNILANRKLHGRFLHLTDLHPDEFYKFNSAVAQFCHRKAPKKKGKGGKGKSKHGADEEEEGQGEVNDSRTNKGDDDDDERAGWFGVPFSDCDSPVTLVNLTLDHLHEEWSTNIDFVIWTGDSARHDNDNLLPRTPPAIYAMNRIIASQMASAFPNIPILPSIGNNDIWPHNVMAPGPNSILNEYIAIWRPFIPFSSYQVFQHGGYFSVEVIPGHIAAISLNTMYWYDANKAVGGCVPHMRDDPGNLQFDWLDVQIERFRDRGMQVILAGHVPPTPGNYFPDCHFRYGQIAIRYQDTIIGHFFGHMNVDHFFWLDVHDLNMEPTEPTYRVMKNQLDEDLRQDITHLPKHLHHDDYVVVNVGPSVIPEYYPSYRIYQYNITQYPGAKISDEQSFTREEWDALEVSKADDEDEDEDEDDDNEDTPHPPKRKRSAHSPHGMADHRLDWTTGKRKHGHRHPEKPDCSLPENEDKYACRPWGPRHASPDSPSRNNSLWSLLGYAQYYLSDLGESTKKSPPKFKLEYLTFNIDALRPPVNDTDSTPPDSGEDGVMGRKKRSARWIPPVPKHLLPKSLRDVNRTKSKFTPYQLDDLTIPSWIVFARKLGKSKKLWKQFIGFMYMGEDLEESEVDPNPDEPVIMDPNGSPWQVILPNTEF